MSWGFGDDKKGKNSVFEPVDSHSKSFGESTSQDSWGYSTKTSNDWHFSGNQQEKKNSAFSVQPETKNGNFYSQNTKTSSVYGASSASSSWAFSASNSSSKGHWSSSAGYGFGDASGFGHDHDIRRMESLHSSSSSWGGDGSNWHFSNAGRSLDLYHGINEGRRRVESNDSFSSSWGHSSTSSHFSTTKSWGSQDTSAPSTFNPFSSPKKKW